jgi:hypothetical protein
MRVPKESLDDFRIGAARKPAEPPPVKFLRPSGRFEVLKPLARSKDFAKRRSATASMFIRPIPSPAARRLSWYQRSVAFSVGLAVIALIVGIVAGIYDVPGPTGMQSDLVIDRQPEEMPRFPNEPDDSAASPAASASLRSDPLHIVRSAIRQRRPRPHVRRASYRPRRLARPSHLVMSSFVPTTLIIYIENGEIKTRIEPQLNGKKKS